MCLKLTLLLFYAAISPIRGAVLLWGTQKVQISPLQSFDDDSLKELVGALGVPYKLYKSPVLFPQLEDLLKGFYVAYNPNDELDTENATEIASEADLESLLANKGDFLSVLVIASERNKRAAPGSPTTDTSVEDSNKTSSNDDSTPSKDELDTPKNDQAPSSAYSPPKGAVFLSGSSKKNKSMYGLLYSSQPLEMVINGARTFIGGASGEDMVYVDTHRDTTRLNAKVNIGEKNLLILRFIFTWSPSRYWTLASVNIENNNITLDIVQKVTAPARFSYHCGGNTSFIYKDKNTTAELYVFDMQVQIDANNGAKFGDAYDCVDFTTGPILSGLFTTAILGVGLIVGLVALSEIKTMDKFDNHKTKQLVITVSE